MMQQKKRIEEILRKRDVALSRQVEATQDILKLDRVVRLKIVDELTDELTEKGLGADSEPNKYGHEIEGLIDFCGLTKS